MQPEKPIQNPSPDPITPESQPPQASAPGASQKKRRFPVWAIITLSLVGFIALIGAFIAVIFNSIAQNTQEPSDNAVTFVKTIQDGNVAEAYTMTSSNFRKLTTQNRLQSIVDEAGTRLNGELAVTDKSVKTFRNSTTAQILMEIDGSPKTFLNVSMVFVDDEWQVNGIRFDDVPFQPSLDE